MNITLDVSFPSLLQEYLNAPCVKSQLLDLVLNSDVEETFISNFSYFINKKYGYSRQMVSITEFSRTDLILFYIENGNVTNVEIIEFKHSLNIVKDLKAKVERERNEDIKKIEGKKGELLKFLNHFYKVNNGINIILYHCTLISEIKKGIELPGNFVDNFIKYKKLWATYIKSLHGPLIKDDRYFSNDYVMKNNENNEFDISKSVSLRNDINLNFILNEIIELNFNPGKKYGVNQLFFNETKYSKLQYLL